MLRRFREERLARASHGGSRVVEGRESREPKPVRVDGDGADPPLGAVDVRSDSRDAFEREGDAHVVSSGTTVRSHSCGSVGREVQGEVGDEEHAGDERGVGPRRRGRGRGRAADDEGRDATELVEFGGGDSARERGGDAEFGAAEVARERVAQRILRRGVEEFAPVSGRAPCRHHRLDVAQLAAESVGGVEDTAGGGVVRGAGSLGRGAGDGGEDRARRALSRALHHRGSRPADVARTVAGGGVTNGDAGRDIADGNADGDVPGRVCLIRHVRAHAGRGWGGRAAHGALGARA